MDEDNGSHGAFPEATIPRDHVPCGLGVLIGSTSRHTLPISARIQFHVDPCSRMSGADRGNGPSHGVAGNLKEQQENITTLAGLEAHPL